MDAEAITAMVSSLGVSSVWLAWAIYERRRNLKLQEARIRELKSWVNFLAKGEVFPTAPNGNNEED